MSSRPLQEELTEKIKYLEARIKVLEDSKNYYKAFFDHSLYGAVILDHETMRPVEFNDKACKQLGYTREEFARLSLSEIEAQETYEETRANIKKVIEKSFNDFETLHRTKQGELRNVNVLSQLIRVEGKQVYHCIWRDITEKKRATEALKESEEKFRHIFESSVISKSLTYPSGEMQPNKAFCDMLGYSQDEFRKLTWQDITHPDDIEFSKKVIDSLRSGVKQSERFIKRYIHKNGTVIWADVSTVLFRDKENNPLYFMTTISDITEHKQMQEEIIRISNEWQTTFNSTQSAIWILDKNQKVIRANKTSELFFQRPNSEIIGKHCWEIVHKTSQAINECPTRRLIHSLKRESMELQIGEKWFHVTVDPIVGSTGEYSGTVHIITDFTEHKKWEEERIAAEAKLQQAMKMEAIGTLAGGIAHDFNNILSTVIGYAELSLLDSEQNSVISGNLNEILKAGLRAKDLVKQILTFARQSHEDPKPVIVSVIAKESLKFIRASIPATIEIKQIIESDSLIMADPTQIHQMFMNLFTNAAQAMEENGGTLKVELKDVTLDMNFLKEHQNLRPGKYLEIKVSDTGHGIPQQIIKSIFEPYFTTKSPGEGTGLGLALIHGIVKNCRGEILVESEVGKGSTFIVYLPILKERGVEVTEIREIEELPVGNERIMVIDDEPTIANVVGQNLKGLGYEVSIRTSGIDALELFRNKPDFFDLIITDLTMPNMTGDKLAVELKKIRPDIPVILCTGYSKNYSDKAVSKIGINAFIYKPIVKADLAKIVRKVLDEFNRDK